jgi:transposase
MDPYHLVALAGDKLDLCRQRVQQDTLGHRGARGPALPGAPHPAHPPGEEHIAVAVTWWTYQEIIAAYAEPDPQRGKALLTAVIDRLRTGLPAGLEELATLGRTLHRRRGDVLAYFSHRASNGPTEAIVSSPVPEERRVGRALGDVLLMQ